MPCLSLVNVADLNRVLRSELFVSEDRQLRAVYLILDFEPLSDAFQDVGHAIRAGNPRLRRIDISVPEFLACEDVVPVELPFQHALPEATAPREETTSLHLSFEEEIDQFQLEEEGEVRVDPIEISDFKGELDRSSVARSPKLIIAKVDNSFEEEDTMALNLRKGLKDLLTRRNKGSSCKEAPKSRPLTILPPPLPPLTTTVGLLPMPNLKKKRKEQEVEEGEMVH